MRRYRVYLLAAIFSLTTLYYLTRSGAFEIKRLGQHNRAAGFKGHPIPKNPEEFARPKPAATAVFYDDNTLPDNEPPRKFDDRIEPEVSPTITEAKPVSTSSRTQSSTTLHATNANPPSSPLLLDETEEASWRYEVSAPDEDDDSARVRWKKPKAQYPLRANEIISLPSSTPPRIPKIQTTFGRESASQEQDRLEKLSIIKESFVHAWNGYKKYGLPHDEVKPLSKSFADPFMGWGATLVDTLDTLWIMDLKQEFKDALVEVEKIDFKTSIRSDIPLFETVIRYLGGLVAAYDISGAKYSILLEKAEELAEILMGAFDTPNRMPITFYNWKPAAMSVLHRASSHAVMSELGSLSVEMTRLAQITKKHEYYDAVARIANELEKWQPDTRLPGLWPLKLDASGCKKVGQSTTENTKADEKLDSYSSEVSKVDVSENDLLEKADYDRTINSNLRQDEDYDHNEDTTHVMKRDIPAPMDEHDDHDESVIISPGSSRATRNSNLGVFGESCIQQGLASEKDLKTETFAIGGQADSTYEYFPKMHVLLRGRNKQYKSMYLEAMTSIRENLLFRPMIKEKDREILFAARQEFTPKAEDPKKRTKTVYEVTHLSCFIGGMVGMGAKLFDIEEDLHLAKQLTDGCVWAYESMPVGIMAESASVVPCPDIEVCVWNETRWHEALDPEREERFKAVILWNKNQEAIYERSKKQALMNTTTSEEEVLPEKATATEKNEKNEELEYKSDKVKRDGSFDIPSKTDPLPVFDEAANFELHSLPSLTAAAFVPKTALPHDKFIRARIEEERLPESYTKIFDRHYGLRPEAIESVFYMYRITGDRQWREKGWQMFLAIQAATQTEVANAAVKDVTSVLGILGDTMESFWLAETLKYFYLLFSSPDVVSLDEWVLNTEAHPMKILVG